MLNAIVGFAIRFRGVVIALACLLVVYGLWTLTRMRLDVFPEFAPPLVQVQTEAPGLSPEQVETRVTQPLENALNGAGGLKSLRSRSIPGLSVITLVFAAGSDIYRDRQLVAERLGTAAPSLPLGVNSPVVLPLSSSAGVVRVMGLTSATRSLMDLRTIAEQILRPQLLSMPGIAEVSIFGRDQRQLQIQVHPRALVHFDLSLNEIAAAARRATGVRGAGFIATPNQNIVLAPQGQANTPDALAKVVLRHVKGATLHIGDVADVRWAPAPPIGAAAINGQPGVILVVQEQYKANTLTVSRALDRRLDQLAPLLADQKVNVHPDLFRPTNFIHTALRNLESALAVGAVLIVAVLFLFLYNVRTAFISVIAIPLSLLAAVIVLNRFDVGINVMTLGGLAVALGELADDAIIDVENIFRRLRENRQAPDPLPFSRVVLDASLEVRGAVVYATFIVALVFLPVLTLSGVAGRLFGPLALAYLAAIFASLAVALTVTPALASVLLPRVSLAADEPRFTRWLKRHYRRWLAAVQHHARAAIAAVAVVVIAALATLPFFSGQFLPALKEGHYIIHMRLTPGASLAAGLRLGDRVTAAVRSVPGVQSVAQRVGRASRVSDPAPSYSSELEVELKPLSAQAQSELLAQLRRTLDGFAGASFAVDTFLTERIHETIGGYAAPVIVNIFGNDLGALDRAARDVARVLSGVPGARGVQVQAPPGSPQLTIHFDPRALARWGIAPADALAAIEAAYQGARVGQVYQGGRPIDVTVIFAAGARRNPEQVGALLLKNPAGILVPLKNVADIQLSAGRFLVLHEGAQRVQTVTAYVAGRSPTAFVRDAEKRVHADARLPPGTYAIFGGAAEERAAAARDLLVKSAMAVAGIVLLLYVALGTLRSLALVLANLPFALVGGVAVVLASGGTLSLGSLVGFVTLFGISVRNSIMLISHYRHLVRAEGMPWGPEAALRGASERLVPILMTALVTALGLLPLAVGSGAPGREIEGPTALVILGGLATSTALNLLLLPTLALRFGQFRRNGGGAPP